MPKKTKSSGAVKVVVRSTKDSLSQVVAKKSRREAAKRSNSLSSQPPILVTETQKGPSIGRQILRSAGGLAGNALSELTDVPGLGALGTAAGDFIGNVFGFGKYTLRKNSLMTGRRASGTSSATQAPMFVNTKAAARIVHREFIMNVNSSVDFSATRLELNPGLGSTFPWLSSIAKNYETYKFNGLLFTYVPTSGMVTSTNPALGSVMLSTQYDPLDAPFESKHELLGYEFSTVGVPYTGFHHPVECDPHERSVEWSFVRSGSAPGDLRLYDYGNTSVASEGSPSEYVAGELWVSYDVSFERPKVAAGAPGQGSAARYTVANCNNSGEPFGGPGGLEFTTTYDTISTPDNPICVATSEADLMLTRAGAYLMVFAFQTHGGIAITGPPVVVNVGSGITQVSATSIASSPSNALSFIMMNVDVHADSTVSAINGMTIHGPTSTVPYSTIVTLLPVSDELYTQSSTGYIPTAFEQPFIKFQPPQATNMKASIDRRARARALKERIGDKCFLGGNFDSYQKRLFACTVGDLEDLASCCDTPVHGPTKTTMSTDDGVLLHRRPKPYLVSTPNRQQIYLQNASAVPRYPGGPLTYMVPH